VFGFAGAEECDISVAGDEVEFMGRDAGPDWKEGKEGWGVFGVQADPCEEGKGWDGTLLEGKSSKPLDRGLEVDEPPNGCEFFFCGGGGVARPSGPD